MKTFLSATISAAVLACAVPATAATYVPLTSVDYGYIHGLFTITDNGPDVLNVHPGETFTVAGHWSVTDTNNAFCPGCIIQLYLAGLSPLNGQADLAQGIGFNGNGAYSLTLTAPTTEGAYYIGGQSSLQFHYIPVNGGANGNGNVNYQVNVVPEPATWAMMILGVAGVGGALRRRKNGTALASA